MLCTGVEPGKIIDLTLPWCQSFTMARQTLATVGRFFDKDGIPRAEPELQHGIRVKPCLAALILRISAIHFQVYLGHYL